MLNISNNIAFFPDAETKRSCWVHKKTATSSVNRARVATCSVKSQKIVQVFGQFAHRWLVCDFRLYKKRIVNFHPRCRVCLQFGIDFAGISSNIRGQTVEIGDCCCNLLISSVLLFGSKNQRSLFSSYLTLKQ